MTTDVSDFPSVGRDSVPAPGVVPIDCTELARALNRGCQCFSIDRAALDAALGADALGADLDAIIREGRPHLFSHSTVFVGEREIARIAQIVSAVEAAARLAGYRERVLGHAPQIARFEPRARGVFLGYDFHLGAAGPQLIEINTNAGGALLNGLLGRASRACCGAVAALLPGTAGSRPVEQVFLDMFRDEWRLERGDAPLRRIAIVDEHPMQQYLYPEFVLFQHLFERAGHEAVICEPQALEHRDGALLFEGRPVDLVYNRLTDFALEGDACSSLREAYLARGVVVTPHPRAHAIYADKRNLSVLSDPAALAEIGADPATRETLLAGIPRVERVEEADRDALWARRRELFFKPAAGYGSRAAYRGDKLTRRVFEEILRGGYVAQSLALPSERRLSVDGAEVDLKMDVRAYVYAGGIQLVAARLYRGQATNFRTPGGGFAPVLTVPCVDRP